MPQIKPLLTALRDRRARVKLIGSAKAENDAATEANQKERDALKDIDPKDGKKLDQLTRANTMKEALGNRHLHLDGENLKVVASMEQPAEELRLELDKRRQEERAAVIDRAVQLWRPFGEITSLANGEIVDGIRNLANQLPVLREIDRVATPRLSWPDFPRDNNPEGHDRAAVDYVEELLRIADAYEANNRSFTPSSYAKATEDQVREAYQKRTAEEAA